MDVKVFLDSLCLITQMKDEYLENLVKCHGLEAKELYYSAWREATKHYGHSTNQNTMIAYIHNYHHKHTYSKNNVGETLKIQCEECELI